MTEDRRPGVSARAALYAAAEARRTLDPDGPVTFDELCAAPWHAETPEETDRIAAVAALIAVAPRLKRRIDGAVFAPLAEVFGEDILEAALALEIGIDRSDIDLFPTALDSAGEALLAAASGGDAEAVLLLTAAARLERSDRAAEAA